MLRWVKPPYHLNIINSLYTSEHHIDGHYSWLVHWGRHKKTRSSYPEIVHSIAFRSRNE